MTRRREQATAFAGVVVPAQPVRVNTYDAGWYDVGLRPVLENPGLGGSDPFGNPLSWTEYFQKVLRLSARCWSN